MSDKYILNEKHEPVPCNDLMEWGAWMEKRDARRVAQDKIGNDIRVSTVFLGLDHSFTGDEPVLFETMIFGGEHDQYQERCSTWSEAEKMHARALTLVKGEPSADTPEGESE